MVKSKIELNKVVLPTSIYSDGSVDVSIPTEALLDIRYQSLIVDLVDPAGILALLQVLEYLKEKDYKVNLAFSYLPNARQERTQELADQVKPNTFKAFARSLSAYRYTISNVLVVDPHSETNLTILREFGFNVRVHTLANLCPSLFNIDYIIAPDKGAIERTKELSEKTNIPFLVANKERNPITHDITLSFDTDVNLVGKNVIIVDDIIDGGRTFIALAKVLKENFEVKKIDLYVTFGIFSYGWELLTPNIDSIWCYYTFLSSEQISQTNGYIRSEQYL